jgi:hypothetical protein
MSEYTPPTYTAFAGATRIVRGPLPAVVVAVHAWLAKGGEPVLLFDDRSGRQVDLDLRGTQEEALARLDDAPWLQGWPDPEEKRQGPGRPKLGVVSREVSLLPRHWDWLNDQRGGASATLRKLVETQLRREWAPFQARRAHDALSKFLWNMAGNLPDFEEASRALTRREYERLDALIAAWPPDIRDHVRELVQAVTQAEKEAADD